jgi:tetratricopeptide (TPR) repeat protein
MQGTAITMRTAAIQNTAKTTSDPQTPAPEKKSDISDQPKEKKKTSPWMWVSIGLIALFCCAFVFVLVRNNNRLARPLPPGIPTFPPITQPTIAPILQPTNQPPPTPQDGIGGTPPFGSLELIDDFEAAPPINTSGWEAYFQEGIDAKVMCEPNPEFVHGGAKSLKFDFNLPAQSWATCGFYYDRTKDWSHASGIAFYMRTNLPGLVFDIALYSGTTDKRSTYVLQMKAPPGSEADWTPVKIHWGDVLRAEWEENPGTPFKPTEVTGFSIGFSGSTPEQLTGTIWLDDLALISEPDPAFGSGTPAPDSSASVQDARKLVEQNPNDPNAHLQLSIALWDTKQVRPAMEELTQALNLAGPDNADFMITAAGEFRKREAWAATMSIYMRLAPHYESAGGMPEDIKTNFHEAVYKASQIKEPQSLDLFTRIDAIDPQLGHIARGRQALFSGNIQEAKLQLAKAEKIEPLVPEIFLLKAEIAMKEGNPSDAKYIIDNTINNPITPEWIRFMMENYLKGMQ